MRPGAWVIRGDALGTPGECDHAAGAGLVEDQRDTARQRVGQVGQGELLGVVDDVLARGRGIALVQHERGVHARGRRQHLQRVRRRMRIEVVAIDRFRQQAHARKRAGGAGRIGRVWNAAVEERAVFAQGDRQHLAPRLRGGVRRVRGVDAGIEHAMQFGLHLAGLRRRQVPLRHRRRRRYGYVERAGILRHSRTHHQHTQRFGLRVRLQRHQGRRWHRFPAQERP